MNFLAIIRCPESGRPHQKRILKSLVVKLGDTKLQKEKSFMLKNLDLCRTVCENMPLN